MRRLKHSECHSLKLRLWEQQKHLCPLCNRKIEMHDSVLDHDHRNGMIRSVMHDRCNRALGFIEWSLQHIDAKTFFSNICKFLEAHQKSPTQLIHPRHARLTEEKTKRERRLPQTILTPEQKEMYKRAIAAGPTAHPNPKKNTNPLGSWARTAETFGVNHGRLLSYVAGQRSLSELE